ncbi:zf-HC2 domain-containing protein [Undibacterium sp. Jales W-56]|uniref:zf-HC2 domain-containing protein n=1 Tax=Undibacterium sp. Jales W-56 TaxID=2897325 RepID=UPI0021D03D44|nr:zf-HC2 domain-containing protein [Undibacterium sp. Jales W-56]MCU6434957.1 zf-HC2 domain-containing protein [Undibacterium sp. Jales W-56]
MRLLISCKQAHQMVSEGLDRHLSLGERARLKMHLSMCHGCTNFNGQMQLLRRAMRKLPLRDDTGDQDHSS